MANVLRPGIHKRWLSHTKSYRRNQLDWIATYIGSNSAILQRYAEDGLIPLDRDPAPCKMWEYSLDSYLTMQGYLMLGELELAGMDSGSFDHEKATAAFAALYAAGMIELRLHAMSLERTGRQLGHMGLEGLTTSALGMIIGKTEPALLLARLQLEVFRRNWTYWERDQIPVHGFMLRLFAAYLGEPPPELTGLSAEHPVLRGLFDCWSAASPDELVPWIVAACDVHTHICSGKEIEETVPLARFTRIPIEILLLFKLRQQKGLANPQVDHPLMSAPLGVLPEEACPQADPLIAAVLARMVADGFDEREISTRVMSRS